MSRRLVLALLLCVLAPAGPATADEWYDAYGKGLQALDGKEAGRAIAHLERAIQKRPEPGRNLLTYGTNRLGAYHPYLALARAHLLAGDAAAARRALERSASLGREPESERLRLHAEVEAHERSRAASSPPAARPVVSPPPTQSAIATPQKPPDTTLPPRDTFSPTPPTETARTVEVAAPPPAAAASSPKTPGTPAPLARANRPAAGEPSPTAEPTTPPSPPPVSATLVVFTEPPGALVYLDDEPIGATDPASGRLVKSGVRPGLHRVRAGVGAGAGVPQEIVVAAEGPTTVRLVQVAHARRVPWPLVALVVGLLVSAAGLRALHRHRSTARAVPGSGAAPTSPSDFDESLETGTMSILPPTPSPRAPERFGPYLLVELLGRGGMAHVFRAERGSDEMALKRPLVSFLEEPEFRERFLREAEIGRTLHHPNIIRIYERGDVSGVPYLTMELLKGETLHARVQRAGALPPRQAAEIARQVAEALDYAHLKGVVHRDLKPSNIMLPAEGELKVMDYGIARARRFEGLTATGAFLGTPEYVAPETAEGRGVDQRSDLYSLGVVIYEMLTGKRPFVGDSPFSTIQKHCSEPPTPPSAITAVPPELERIVLRLMAKRPEERHPSAEELLIELREFLNRTPGAAAS